MKQKGTIRITLIGDIFPGELDYTQNYGIRTQFEKHKGIPWIKEIKNIIGKNDIVIGNLESPLVAKVYAIKKTFYGNPEFVFFLKECGIDVINVANNHIMEQGIQGFNSTIQALKKAKLGIIGHIVDSKSKILYRDVKGLKIAIAGFCNVDMNVIQNNYKLSVLNNENVINALKSMEGHKSNLKILCFHWGNEYVHVPSLEQRKMAYQFIDNGADVIVGHHPHVIQPYEKYKKGHIFYSLGNFNFDFVHSKMVSIGLIATLEINESNRIYVNLNGVKLSYKKTVNLLPSHKFEKYYIKIKKMYDELIILNDVEYKKSYQALHKRNHLWQRIIMKTSIINELIRIKKKDKIKLIKNIYNYNIKEKIISKRIK
jgi:hypothetical protein